MSAAFNRDELWLRYVEGDTLSADEEKILSSALSADGDFCRECLKDQAMIGLMREAQRQSEGDGANAMVRDVLQRLHADDNADTFVQGVMDKLPTDNSANDMRIVTPSRRRRRSRSAASRRSKFNTSSGPGLWSWVSMAAVVAMGVFLWVNHGAPEPSWTVVSVEGSASQGGRPVQAGAILYAGVPITNQGHVVLSKKGSTVQLKHAAEVVLLSSQSGDTWLVRRGAIECQVAKQPAGKTFQVQTSHATSRVVGTRFTVSHLGQTTRLDVVEGRVAFDDLVGKKTSVLSAGESIESTPPAVTPVVTHKTPKTSKVTEATKVAPAPQPSTRSALVQWDFTTTGLTNTGSLNRIAFTPPDGDGARGVRLDQTGKGGLVCDGTAALVTTMAVTPLIQRIKTAQAVTIVLRVDPDETFADFKTQKIGPARIMTISGSSHLRNLTLGQGEMKVNYPGYSARVRRQEGSGNGLPAMVSTKPASQGVDTLVLVVDRRGTQLYVNGQRVAKDDRTVKFAQWDETYHLALGAEVHPDDTKGIRGWRGVIHHLSFYDRAFSASDIKNLK